MAQFLDFRKNDEPMWGNIGSELNKLFPNQGWNPDFSEVGFWGGEKALLPALQQAMTQQNERSRQRSAENIAAMNSGAQFDSARLGALGNMYRSNADTAQNELSRRSAEDIARMQYGPGGATDRQKQMDLQRTRDLLGTNKVKVDADLLARLRRDGVAAGIKDPMELDKYVSKRISELHSFGGGNPYQPGKGQPPQTPNRDYTVAEMFGQNPSNQPVTQGQAQPSWFDYLDKLVPSAVSAMKQQAAPPAATGKIGQDLMSISNYMNPLFRDPATQLILKALSGERGSARQYMSPEQEQIDSMLP